MASKCEICQEAPPKYKCPGCEKKTCSLPCVQQHKQQTDCDGLRKKTAYVTVKSFDDLRLLSDYRFLEDTGRRADSAARDNFTYKKKSNFNRSKLMQQCRQRNIQLLSMPFNMTKRKTNHSRYIKQRDSINWTVEWNFPLSGVKYTASMMDSSILQEELDHYLHPTNSDPIKRHRLRAYINAGVDTVRVLIRVEGCKANSLRYRELNTQSSLVEILTGHTLIEYPSLIVVPSSLETNYPIYEDGDGQNLQTALELFNQLNRNNNQEGETSHGGRGHGRYRRGYRGRNHRGGRGRNQTPGSAELGQNGDRS